MATDTSPEDALHMLDGILEQVAGTRKDHVAIQGAVLVIATALRPPKDSEKRLGHELQGSEAK